MVSAAGADDKLAYAADRVDHAGWRLWRKPLVNVVVGAQNQVGIMIVQRLPEWLGVTCGAAARAEQRYMPVGQRAEVRVGGEIGLKPFSLRRAGATAARIPAIGI